ncbi:MAG: non-homologous end-joining DNA ligase [Ilumatobacter sp.]|uniref:non-homologous end-joining DNA ligase n=1 Tax=Ilumatobacter sp. TaxID=1967498 RepID=UPI002632CF82|nr:non-homologous end-joining DNA ligase [Ilumatobacter sp.]MDJ0767980.1 non-homologous end-joining DNA ligase [Ilumatobacter sp.]
MPLTFPVAPMKATLGSLPADDDRWAFEVKFDGYRTLAFVDGESVRLQSSNQHDVTASYPELTDLPQGVNAGIAVLDGELVVLDDDGRPRFELMQRHEREAVYQVFDVLRIDDHDTIGLPYEDRRRLLEQLVEPGPNWLVPAHSVGGGAALLAATGAQGLEGIMAKRLASTWVPGKRTPNWRKIKHRRRTEVVIGGFTAGEGNRASTFGSLLVGRWDGPRLAFAGGVGTGFDQVTLDRLGNRLRDIRTGDCPFDPIPPAPYRRHATWVEPTLSALIEMTEFTNDGLVRHASFIELVDGS